ncbi:MAG: hypothetical protein WA484_13275 [Solirubrobacteraceae bacterium]
MNILRIQTILALAALTTLASLPATARAAGQGPVKLVPTTQVGFKVDKTTGKNTCPILSSDECQPGIRSEEPGSFAYPEAVAAAPTGNVYVVDQGNRRIQELTPSGEFMLMFGREVNATTNGDVCTAHEIEESGVKCRAGAPGATEGALAEPQDIAVDPSTGNVYVAEYINSRIDEYTAGGQFVLMFGKEVDATTHGDVCTASSKDLCQAGVRAAPESTEKRAFAFAQFAGNLLSVGGAPEHLLYVGDEHRVQEFDAAGEWKGEFRLPPAVVATSPAGSISAIAYDMNSESVSVVYEDENTVRTFSASTGAESSPPIELPSKQAEGAVDIFGIAIDAIGHLAISARESGLNPEQFGLLFNASTGRVVSAFTIPEGKGLNSLTALGFNGQGGLYLTITEEQDLVEYASLPIGELVTEVPSCSQAAELKSLVTFDCTLHGKVNPYSVPNTEVWFDWERGCGSPEFRTLAQPVPSEEVFIAVSAQIEGLRPNQEFCDLLAAIDQNVRLPEELTGETASFSTPMVPPKLVGAPSASFVKFSSALLYAELNPENAPTEYFFEYAPERKAGEKTLEKCKGLREGPCSGVSSTPVLQSAAYGRIGATLGVNGLRPGTAYRYRLAAIDEAGPAPPDPEREGKFTTALAPSLEAVTLPASNVTAGSVVASGTVNPDGQQATYSFELGVYEGAATRYDPVVSGPTGKSFTAEPESATLANLQPSTIYAYRFVTGSGFGTAAGAPVIFTTGAVPSPPPNSPVTLLEIPPIKFPVPPPACRHGYKRSKDGGCVKVKAKKKGKAVKGRGKKKTSKGK